MNLTTLPSMDAALEYERDFDFNYRAFSHGSGDSGDISSRNIPDNKIDFNNLLHIMDISMFIICLLGVEGNGIIIWLLGFCVQRNPFMTYILNLAIADLGLLISVMLHLDPFEILPLGFHDYFPLFIMYSASQFLLTAISIDRCVAVFFPLWHRCHRPPRFSTIVCALMWVLSLVLTTVTLIIQFVASDTVWVDFVQFYVNAVLCLPLVTISTVALFVKVCFKRRQHQRGKLLTILLLALSFFLLCAFPLNVILILAFMHYLPDYSIDVAILLSCLNSSVNPFIYFLVGRQRKPQHRESLKMILQRAFKDEEGGTEEAPAETQL